MQQRSSSPFLRELVKVVVAVRGFYAVAVLLRAVAHGIVGVAARIGQPLGAHTFLGQLAVFVIFPDFGRSAAAERLGCLRQPPLGITFICKRCQGFAAIGVRDLRNVPRLVVGIGAGGTICTLYLRQTPRRIVLKAGRRNACAAGVCQGLQSAARIPRRINAVFPVAFRRHEVRRRIASGGKQAGCQEKGAPRGHLKLATQTSNTLQPYQYSPASCAGERFIP